MNITDDNKRIITVVLAVLVLILLILAVIKTNEVKNIKNKEATEVTDVDETNESETEVETTRDSNITKTTDANGEEVYIDSSGNIVGYAKDDDKNNKESFTDLGNLLGVTKEDKQNGIFNLDVTETANETKISVEETVANVESTQANKDDNKANKDGESEIVDYERYAESVRKGTVSEYKENTGNITINIDRTNDDNYDYVTIGTDRDNGVFDCEVGIYRDGIVTGADADAFLLQVNATNRVKYKISCDDGFENVVIPYKIKYLQALESESMKIEPVMCIGYNLLDYIQFNGKKVTPKISMLYTVKNVDYREGYIITKVPVGRYTEYKIKVKGYNKDASGEIKL